MSVVSGGVKGLSGSPVLLIGVLLSVLASDVLVPVAWWRGDRLLWWVVPGVILLAGLFLTALFPPRNDAARAGVAAVAFIGQLVFAVLFGVIAFMLKLESRYGYLLALLVFVLAVVSLLALARGGDVRDAALPALITPFVLFVDKVPAVNWMTIQLPLLLAFALLLVQAGLVWHALMRLPESGSSTPQRARHI